jgi:hypothetical protein
MSQEQIIIHVPECGHVTYQEFNNKWVAHREGATVAEKDSLSEAKRFLTDLVKREEAKDSPFKRHEAYLVEHWGLPKQVTVTSYASEHEAWVRNAEGTRSKESLDRLRAFGGLNKPVIDRINQLDTEIDQRQDEVKRLKETLKPYKKVG